MVKGSHRISIETLYSPAMLVTTRFLVVIVQPVPHCKVVYLNFVHHPYFFGSRRDAKAAEEQEKEETLHYPVATKDKCNKITHSR